MATKKCNVIIQTAFLGDLLLSIPLLKKVKSLWPDMDLVLVCRQGLGDFFIRTKLVDQVYEIKKGNQASYNSIVGDLQKRNICKIISPHQSLRTALFTWSLQAEEKISFYNIWNRLFFSTRVRRDKSLPDAIRQISLVAKFDTDLARQIEDYARSQRAYEVGEEGRLSAVPGWCQQSLKSVLSSDQATWIRLQERLGLESVKSKKWILLFPGSVWATKRWGEQGFVELGQALVKKGYQIIIMGGPGEEGLCRQVAEKIGGALNLAGQTSVYESSLIILNSALVIGNDSASMHLASCCEAKMISVFGPTVLNFGYRPWSDQVYVIEEAGLSCRPCGPHGHHQCPLGTHVCMKNIKADRIIKRSEFILQTNP